MFTIQCDMCKSSYPSLHYVMETHHTFHNIIMFPHCNCSCDCNNNISTFLVPGMENI